MIDFRGRLWSVDVFEVSRPKVHGNGIMVAVNISIRVCIYCVHVLLQFTSDRYEADLLTHNSTCSIGKRFPDVQSSRMLFEEDVGCCLKKIHMVVPFSSNFALTFQTLCNCENTKMAFSINHFDHGFSRTLREFTSPINRQWFR